MPPLKKKNNNKKNNKKKQNKKTTTKTDFVKLYCILALGVDWQCQISLGSSCKSMIMQGMYVHILETITYHKAFFMICLEYIKMI